MLPRNFVMAIEVRGPFSQGLPKNLRHKTQGVTIFAECITYSCIHEVDHIF